MCKSEKNIYQNFCCNTTMDWLNPSQSDCILHQLKQLPIDITNEEFNNLKSLKFEPYGKLLEKYRNKPFNGIALIDIIEIINGYLNVLENKYNMSLHKAIQNDNTKNARLLIEADANLNIQDYDGKTPLHFAIYKPNTEIAKLLIKAGADVKAIDKNGNTPLHNAIYKRNTEIAKLLIEKGADLNATTKNGFTPLEIARWSDNTQAEKLLREYGAT